MENETFKCIFCGKKLKINDIIIGSNKWAYCKKCKKPILDMTIQSAEHFLKRNEAKIEKETHIKLMLEGYFA